MEKIAPKEKNLTVGRMVAENYKKAAIFKQYGIDFCCGGGISLEEACKLKNVDINEIQNILKEIDEEKIPVDENYESWELDELVDYIVDVHHSYVKKANSTVKEFVNRVKLVHGMNKPNVSEISDRFDALASELEHHMHKEEMILFPYIKELVKAKRENKTVGAPFGSIQNPIAMMLHEHDDAGNELEMIQKLTEDYTPPKGACSTHQVSYKQLEEYANDLMRHIHLENNILFPRILESEKSLNA